MQPPAAIYANRARIQVACTGGRPASNSGLWLAPARFTPDMKQWTRRAANEPRLTRAAEWAPHVAGRLFVCLHPNLAHLGPILRDPIRRPR